MFSKEKELWLSFEIAMHNYATVLLYQFSFSLLVSCIVALLVPKVSIFSLFTTTIIDGWREELLIGKSYNLKKLFVKSHLSCLDSSIYIGFSIKYRNKLVNTKLTSSRGIKDI